MGFRSVILSEDTWQELPEWFVERWKDTLHFGVHTKLSGKKLRPGFPIAGKSEFKEYGNIAEDLYADLQKLPTEMKWKYPVQFIWFHECHGVTKFCIWPDGTIKMAEPTGWELVDRVLHDYCYDCSDPEGFTPKEPHEK